MCTTTLTFCFHNLNLIILSGAKVRDGECNRVAKISIAQRNLFSKNIVTFTKVASY